MGRMAVLQVSERNKSSQREDLVLRKLRRPLEEFVDESILTPDATPGLRQSSADRMEMSKVLKRPRGAASSEEGTRSYAVTRSLIASLGAWSTPCLVHKYRSV